MNCFQIDDYDIAEYVKEHKNDLRYNEIFFVEYIKSHKGWTKEGKTILIQKYNMLLLPPEELERKMRNFNSKVGNIPAFTNGSITVRNLDFKGIVYILIPLLKINGTCEFELHEYHQKAAMISDILYIPSFDIYNLRNNSLTQVNQSLSNCKAAGYLKNINTASNKFKITINKKDSQGLIESYESVYGKDNVEEVKYAFQKTLI